MKRNIKTPFSQREGIALEYKKFLNDEKHFRVHYQQRAAKTGVIELTIPDKPRSRPRKYRRTA